MAEFELEPGERVISSVRKHPLIVIGQLIPFVILALIPFLLPVLINLLQNFGAEQIAFVEYLSTENPWTRFVVGMYWLFVWIGAFGIFTDYYLDHWVITNHRIMSIDQQGFFDRKVSSLHLNRIQDVMTDIEGLLGELFGFGTLSVETAGDDASRFRTHGIANAKHVRDLIMKEVTARQENLTKYGKTTSSGIL